MRLLLDANIILDVGLQRVGVMDGSSAVMRLCPADHEAWLAWHTLSNVFYLMRRHTRSWSDAHKFCSALLSWTNVAPTNSFSAARAVSFQFKDLEDAMQVAAAEACGAEFIITRNVSDFTQGSIPALTPEDFLSQYHPQLSL